VGCGLVGATPWAATARGKIKEAVPLTAPFPPPIFIYFPKRSFAIEVGSLTGVHDDVDCGALRWVPRSPKCSLMAGKLSM